MVKCHVEKRYLGLKEADKEMKHLLPMPLHEAVQRQVLACLNRRHVPEVVLIPVSVHARQNDGRGQRKNVAENWKER